MIQRVYAKDLYAHLRFLDHQKCDVIVVEAPPQNNAWAGIGDRLSRASA